MSQTISTLSDERLYDYVVIYKRFNSPRLLESLKSIEKPEVFTELEEFCIDAVKVCTFN